MNLHIDIETYSSLDLKKVGMYRYSESIDFEILMVAYCFSGSDITIIDLAKGEKLPLDFLQAIQNKKIKKYAHNAAFERVCFNAVGIKTNTNQWHCSAIKAAYCGFPLSLAAISKAMRLGDSGKDAKGRALLKYFTVPCKPTKVNGYRSRNMPEHDPEKWQQLKDYCVQDVVAEMSVLDRLKLTKLPKSERQNYIIDQHINDTGINLNLQMATKALSFNAQNTKQIYKRIIELTGVSNPNSPALIKSWLSLQTGTEIKSIAVKKLPEIELLLGAGSVGFEVLQLRKKTSKTSIKKYEAMNHTASVVDGNARGQIQFYGAGRTGRWAGRLIQVQNLPRNYIPDLKGARSLILGNDYAGFSKTYPDVSAVLSQLIRTAIIPSEGNVFAISDFSAIEARVIAWLAGEQWRLDVFNTHGKIYEASAAMMFSIPFESITKDSDERYKGKVAELALGYQGGVGALKSMGAADMGLSELEMKSIVTKWREANTSIVALWNTLNTAAIKCIATGKKQEVQKGRIKFRYINNSLRIELPSGRELYYQSARLGLNQWGGKGIKYKGVLKSSWATLDTYGGKLAENIVQAIARDIMATSIKRLYKANINTVMHVHDEVVCDIPDDENAEGTLQNIYAIMGKPIKWAKGLPLNADGELSYFYKK